MPFNPAGIMSLVATYFAEPGTTIRTEQHNPVFEDVAAALSLTLVRDGRAPMTGPLNMNGFAITNVVAGSSLNSVATLAQVSPIGVVIDFAGTTAPVGWALCYGQAISRTTYAALFAIIGTTYGIGDGSTTFNLPDLRGRVAAGSDAMGGVNANRLWPPLSGGVPNSTVMGSAGGAKGHTLTTAQTQAHSHNGTTQGVDRAATHGHGGGTVEFRPTGGGLDHNCLTPVGTGGAGSGAYALPGTSTVNTDHLHGFTTSTVGSGLAHNNVQPTIIMNKIIRVSYDG